MSAQEKGPAGIRHISQERKQVAFRLATVLAIESLAEAHDNSQFEARSAEIDSKIALLNDLRIYELANAIIEDCIKDQEKIKTLVHRLRL